MPDDFDFSGFAEDVKKDLENGREAFKGKYANELDALLGLSRAEIDKLIPGTADLDTYDQLIAVVKDASRRNLAQAELKGQIQKLGKLAVTIAKTVPVLAKVLV